MGTACKARERPFPLLLQNENRTPSWISRLGKAEVNASGVLGVATLPSPSSVPGRIPCTLNVVNPGVNPKRGLTSLFTLVKFVRFAMLNPSAVNCRFAQFVPPGQAHVEVDVVRS